MNTDGIKSYIKECLDKQTQDLKSFVCFELPEEFQSNPYFYKGKEANVGPSPSFSTGTTLEKCYQKDGSKYPHLFHTFNPQLNNMTDMLSEILNFVCHKQQKVIIDDLEKSRNLLIELIKQKTSLEFQSCFFLHFS